MNKPPIALLSTTLWEYPSQHYGESFQGDPLYKGATPSYVIWNLLKRYTRESDLIVDPMVGSGTTIDVAKDLGRKVRGFDLEPYREDIEFADARKLPLENDSVDFVFIDPPYSTHLKYSGKKECIGELDARDTGYYEAMTQVISEIHRVLKEKRMVALYVSDSFEKKKGFEPIGFKLFEILQDSFTAVDIISVVRHNRSLKKSNWRLKAQEGNFFLRGFNYLFILKKDSQSRTARGRTATQAP